MLMIEALDSATFMPGGYTVGGTHTPGECEAPCRYYDTAADGTFNVPLEPGQYWVRFAAPGWASKWWGDSSLRAGTEMTVTANTFAQQDPVLQHGGSISGTISQASGVHDGWVEAWVADPSFDGGYFVMNSVWADDNGSYQIPNLPDASYRIHFVNNLTKLEGWWHGKDTAGGADPVTIAAGATVTDIDPTLAAFGSISGHVTRAFDGTAVGGETVQVFRETEPSRWIQEPDETVSAPDGTYALPLRSGTYRVRFSGGADLRDAYWNSTLNNPGGSTPVVAINQPTAGVDEALEPITAINTTAPTVFGIQRVGHTATATNGTWYPAAPGYGNDFSYRWTRDGIVVGYSKSYTLRTGDYGRVLHVRVTPNYYASTNAFAQTGVIAKGTFKLTSRPKLYGARTVGSSLYVLGLTSSPTASVHYRWYRDGHRILGATSLRHRLVAADRGHRITVRITLSRTAYTTLDLSLTTSGAVR
ncbi:MAG: hypothetical protein ACJ72L_19700 [Marmoricola sp.]